MHYLVHCKLHTLFKNADIANTKYLYDAYVHTLLINKTEIRLCGCLDVIASYANS